MSFPVETSLFPGKYACFCSSQDNFRSKKDHFLFSDDLRDQKIKIYFRDRFDELLEFAPALHKFLNEASVDHEIFVINQADKYRFNRASLINVGYIYTADKGFDYLGKRFK